MTFYWLPQPNFAFYLFDTWILLSQRSITTSLMKVFQVIILHCVYFTPAEIEDHQPTCYVKIHIILHRVICAQFLLSLICSGF